MLASGHPPGSVRRTRTRDRGARHDAAPALLIAAEWTPLAGEALNGGETDWIE